jgi:Alpha amylase, catalytic domain
MSKLTALSSIRGVEALVLVPHEPRITVRKNQYPSLYEINTRIWIRELSARLGRPATLDDIPDKELDWLAHQGFDWVWLLGVWQTGAAGQRVARGHRDWLDEFREVLPGFDVEDVSSSCFAVSQYSAHSDFGGDAALERLRRRLHERDLRLLLDFVPNHTALDHPWVQEHPEFYVAGTEQQFQQEPQNYTRIETTLGPKVLAHGRDPYFPGWVDTLQLNYSQPSLQEAMNLELHNVASLCDGVRCDMAMLLLPEVFEHTWGLQAEPFWPKAIQSIRSLKWDFLFMAEVYWGLEWTLQQQGFDYTYDKRLYDRLREGHARPVRDHLSAEMEFQRKSVRFLENHDEPRAATTFSPEMHRAAAVVTFLCPGLRFFHDGQFDGRTKRLPVQLNRRPNEPVSLEVHEFYDHLLECVHRPEVRNGSWQLLSCSEAWQGNWTWDCFICFAWQGAAELPLIVVVNYAPHQSQCFVKIPYDEICGHAVHLQDMLHPTQYERDGDDLLSRGLYLDLPEWGYQVFKLTLDSGSTDVGGC